MTEVARMEAFLALPDDRPLRQVPSDKGEPLDGIALACAQAREGERVGVMLGCLPQHHRALRGDAGSSSHPWVAAFRDLALGNGGTGQRMRDERDPVEVSTARWEVREQASKLTAPGVVLAVQLLIRAESPVPARAWHLAQEAAAGLAVWSGENQWRARRVRPWQRRSFDYRWATGAFAPRRRQLVTIPEVDGMLRPPGAKCLAPVVRSMTGLVGPASLPSYDGHPAGVLPLGWRTTPDGVQRVGVNKDDTLFTFLVGGSGRGKTETALNMAIALVRQGEGVWYLDPHGDALDRMKPYICEQHVADRFVEINLAVERATSPTWNLLGMAREVEQYGRNLTHPKVAAALERRQSSLVASFSAAVGWDEKNTRAKSLTEFATRSLLELSVKVPAEVAPTVFQFLPLLSDDAWRDRVLPHLTPPVQAYWRNRFPKLSSEAITPVTNLVDRMSQSAAVVGLLGASVSTFNPRASIDAGQVVLLCPNANESVQPIVANLMLYGLRSAILSRNDVRPEDRVPVWAFLDEAQSYDSASAGTLADLLEQARKFGLHATIMCQSPTTPRLSEATRQALVTNRSHLLAANLDTKGAQWMANQMGHDLNPAAIANLPSFHLVCSTLNRGETTAPYEVRGYPVHELWANCRRSDAEVQALQRRAGRVVEHRSVEATVLHAATLSDRLLAALEGSSTGGGGRRVRTG